MCGLSNSAITRDLDQVVSAIYAVLDIICHAVGLHVSWDAFTHRWTIILSITAQSKLKDCSMSQAVAYANRVTMSVKRQKLYTWIVIAK